MKLKIVIAACLPLLPVLPAAQTVTTEKASPTLPTNFEFPTLPSNSASDLANGLPFVLLDGNQNGSGSLTNLSDGVGQSGQDVPSESFFATDGSNVRVQVDLEANYTLDEINSYSWHRGVRAPQFYQLYGATEPSNDAPTFADAAFRDETALNSLGYDLITSVSTQPLGGGQHAASITGSIGTYRYLLFEMSRANTTDGENGSRGTFFSEIDVYGEPASGFGALALTNFSYDPATGESEVTIEGPANTAYQLTEAIDLDFTNSTLIPLTSATLGSLTGNEVTTDENGNATIQFDLGTDNPTSFIRAEAL